MPNDYFGYFPTVPYETFDGSGKYKVVTDIFKRVRASLQAREDQTVSYEYEVKDKETAEIVSYKYYGYAQYHWVIFFIYVSRYSIIINVLNILISNNIL